MENGEWKVESGELLLALEGVDRVVAGYAPVLEGDGGGGDDGDSKTSKKGDPHVHGCFVGKVLKPKMSGVPGKGRGYDKAN
jgi:hypothetical protein